MFTFSCKLQVAKLWVETVAVSVYSSSTRPVACHRVSSSVCVMVSRAFNWDSGFAPPAVDQSGWSVVRQFTACHHDRPGRVTSSKRVALTWRVLCDTLHV